MDYKKRHIETEKKFYQKMDRQKTFLLTLAIVGVGSFFLYIQYWSVDHCKAIELWLWMLIVGMVFIALTLIGFSVFERERKKWTKK